jgi:hypothetical protein
MLMRLRTLACLLLTVPAALSAQNAAPARIPELHAASFSGAQVDLPQALRGHTGVLLVSFSQSARDNVTAWFRRLAGDYRNSPTVLYYALPDIAGAPGFLRGAIVKKVKESVSAPAQPRFVPILEQDDAWKAAAGFNKHDESGVFILLVDGSGTIRDRIVVGGLTDQGYADLKQKVDRITP